MRWRWAVTSGLCIGFLLATPTRAETEPATSSDSTVFLPLPDPVVVDHAQLDEPPTHLRLRPYYRVDELRWRIAGGGVNIISELDWDDVRSAGLELDVSTQVRRFQLRGSASYGQVYDGAVRDSDFNGSNKTLEFSRSRSSTERGSVVDIEIEAGLPMLRGSRVTLMPLVGLSYHEQNYNIRDGRQIVPFMAPIAGLDSNFDTRWYGFFFGAEVRALVNERLELWARLMSRRAEYRADAEFNLRSDLGDPSFTHDSHGVGQTLRTGARWDLDEHLALELDVDWTKWDTNSGEIEFRLSSGGSSIQRLNDVELESFRAALGLVFTF